MSQYPEIPGTPKNNLRLFYAIITGALFFAVIVIGLNIIRAPLGQEWKGIENIFLAVVAGIAVTCLIIARKGYTKNTELAKDPLISLQDKLNQYRNTLIRYLALCEGHALFGIILFLMTGNFLFLIITAVMIAAMFSKAPTLKRLTDDLALDWNQQQELE